MKSSIIAFLTCLLTIPVSAVCMESNPDISVPVPMVNQNPVQLLFLQPIPDRANALSAGMGSFQVTTTITNTLVDKSSRKYHVRLDLEAVRVCLGMRYGFGSGWEAGVFIPAYYFYGGVLDRFIEGVEGYFGSIREVRKEEEPNRFFYGAEKEGGAFITGHEKKGGFGDAVIMIKKKMRGQEGSWPTLALRAGVKLPAGSKSNAFGSGEWDGSIGILLEKQFSRLNAYVNTDVIFPGNGFDNEGITLREFCSAMIGLEYNLTPDLKAISHIYFYSRPFKHTDVEPLERRIYDLLLGGAYRINKNLFIQAGLVQDILNSADATSDISFFLNLERCF